MYKKLTTLVLALVTLVILLPTQGSAATPDTKEKTFTVSEFSANPGSIPQRRWRNRRWNRNRRMNNRRVRVIRQVFYRNGRRYVRYIRVYR